MREGKCFAELVLDGEGQRDGKDEVGEGEVEDEEVPRRPHGLAPHYSGYYQEIVQNWYLEKVSQIRYISITKLIVYRRKEFLFRFPFRENFNNKKV